MIGETTAPDSWWRRNRLGLALLVPALVLALAAGSSRVQEYWWDRGFHDRAPVVDGVAALVDRYDDGRLRYPVEALYSVASFEPVRVTLSDGAPLPDGLRAWRLRLDVEADPDISLVGCQVAVVDTQGDLHHESDSGLSLAAVSSSTSCVPAETPGPKARFGSTDQPRLTAGESPRPGRFTTDTTFVLPTEATPESVRLWYFLPRYVELSVDSG